MFLSETVSVGHGDLPLQNFVDCSPKRGHLFRSLAVDFGSAFAAYIKALA